MNIAGAEGDPAMPRCHVERPRLWVLLLLTAGVTTAAVFAIPAVQHAMLNRPHVAKVLTATLALLSAPFLLLPLRLRPRVASTKVAWWLAQFMALDTLMLLLLTSGVGTRGHPPLEVMVMLGVGIAKLALLPTALVLLLRGSLRGEQFALLAAGVVCLGAQAVGSMLIL